MSQILAQALERYLGEDVQDYKPIGKGGFAKGTDNPSTINEVVLEEPEEEGEISWEEAGYKVQHATGDIYNMNTDPPERVGGKVGKDGKILFVD